MAKRIIGTTPKQDGYRMPAEFERQAGVWMLWPERNDNWRGGATWVGENGPEIVYLPQHAQITSASESRELGGDTIIVNVSARDVKEFNDLVRIAKEARMNRRKAVS